MTLAQLDSLIKRHNDREEWLDYRTGLVCAIIANVNRDSKKKPEPFTPQDFMPQREQKPERELSPDDLLLQMRIMNAAAGGKEVVN
jgi:hypothetical protein